MLTPRQLLCAILSICAPREHAVNMTGPSIVDGAGRWGSGRAPQFAELKEYHNELHTVEIEDRRKVSYVPAHLEGGCKGQSRWSVRDAHPGG